MSKVLFIFLLFSINILGVFSNYTKPIIIKRSEWGANEAYRYMDSKEWKNILEKWKLNSKKEISDHQKKINKDKRLKVKTINNYLLKIFPENNILTQIIKNDNGHPLTWNIQKTKYVKAIIIHHTESEYKTSLEGINAVYKFHSLSRAWGDIGYNYIIGYDGEIYEGRAGGDYVVGAHAVYNNRSTVSISVMGNYDKKGISDKQYSSLDNLVKFLTKKYGIDLSKQYTYYRECFGDNCKIGVDTYKDYSLVGHRDAGNTNCPGDELHKQIQKIRKENISFTSGFSFIPNLNSIRINKTIIAGRKVIKKLNIGIEKLSERKKLLLLAKIEERLDNLSYENPEYYLYYQIKEIILSDFKSINKNKYNYEQIVKKSFDKTRKITVKLSYPENDFINISVGKNIFEIKRSGKNLLLNGEVKKIISIKSLAHTYFEITSWNRIPSWDKEKKYNDNKFRGDLILYVKKGQLVVLNRLYLFDYLKGLGEVSNSENIVKIKTIITAARTYARWYMTKDKKFPKEFYNASDNPDVFQKYLGYSLEKRSPNVNKIVERTIDEVITYKGNIIKPWYFSSSDGYTKTFEIFCKTAKGVPDCEKAYLFPFLSGVRDPGGIGKKKWGHGIGIAGTGVKYFAERLWTSEMIIKYFLNGVEVMKK